MTVCEVPECPRSAEARGLCHSHFEWSRRHGQRPTRPILDTPKARFLAKVNKLPSGHWIWTGATASEGRYGAFYFSGRTRPAHRVAWVLWRGELDDEQVIDHLCRKTLCVNPEHLEPKTQRANILCGEAPSALNAAKTHCKRGHAFTEQNIRWLAGGGRQCRACMVTPEGREKQRQASARYRERQRVATP